jgi:hypothetical protein
MEHLAILLVLQFFTQEAVVEDLLVPLGLEALVVVAQEGLLLQRLEPQTLVAVVEEADTMERWVPTVALV